MSVTVLLGPVADGTPVAAEITALAADGPIALVTAGWEEAERNDADLQENLDYIAMNPVREGYVTHPQFYPYTGFLY